MKNGRCSSKFMYKTSTRQGKPQINSGSDLEKKLEKEASSRINSLNLTHDDTEKSRAVSKHIKYT